MTLRFPEIRDVVGVDFSGGRNSGLTAWMAKAEVLGGRPGPGPGADRPRLRLRSLDPLSRLAGGEDRETVNRFFVDQIIASDRAVWGFDFPFGLPIELALGPWTRQLKQLDRFAGDAKEYGRLLVARTREVADTMHIRRLTDRETKTPFDCYHYRIIYQTFHGMRDVLRRIVTDRDTCVLPFQFRRLADQGHSVRRLVVEACPSSTLKRLGLPHRLYKQSGGKPPTESQRRVRKEILAGLTPRIELPPRARREIMANPGGDALDAIIAAVGCWEAMVTDDHLSVAKHPRYRLEGRVYA